MADDKKEEEDNKEVIKSPELRLPFYTSIIATIGAVVSGLTPLFDWVTGSEIITPQLMPHVLSLAGVLAIAGAIIVAAEALARAWATAAEKSSVGTSPSSTSVNNGSTPALSPLAMTVAPFKVRVKQEGDELFTVLAISWDAETKKELYLVGRKDEGPRWIKAEQVDRGSYQSAST